ncbi:MAG: ABC transporter ATP-binding protein [Planctomycetes bacterium]|nr:ABC transporter ATP-binding protein [Planctomycetota bacterium]MCB9869016.1 ABC transporter ATP-binding protein [Planctomycetota bacterium]MCB9887976.1 ABC transporter ATP-binding protein [Planctomycetota bacterium]
MSAAVEVRGVSFAYGERVALRDVSVSVERGVTHAFLGPNGSGKSTLFKILATILPPQRGTVRILGLDVETQLAAVRRHLGVVFQAPALDRKLSVRRNLEYGGHLYGLRGGALRRTIDEMLAHTGLRDRANEPVERLSGGLKRRVELAKGLMGTPDVLLLDEPTTGLDPGARKDLWQFLASRSGLTVLATTHLMDEAQLAGRITILHEGGVVAEGTPSELEQLVGGELLQLRSPDPARLAEAVKARFGVETKVLEHTLRIRAADAHRLIGDLVDAFGDQIDAVTLSHPTLEDVYIEKTGHRFWAADAEGA